MIHVRILLALASALLSRYTSFTNSSSPFLHIGFDERFSTSYPPPLFLANASARMNVITLLFSSLEVGDQDLKRVTPCRYILDIGIHCVLFSSHRTSHRKLHPDHVKGGNQQVISFGVAILFDYLFKPTFYIHR